MMSAKIMLMKGGGVGEELTSPLTTLLRPEPSFDLRAPKASVALPGHSPDGSAIEEGVCNEKPDLLIFCGDADSDGESSVVLKLAQGWRFPVIIACQPKDPSEAFALLNQGAADVISPPFKAVDLLRRLCRLLQPLEKEQTRELTLKERLGLRDFVGQSPELMAVIEKIPLVAGADSTVLISGETGTGKEICARCIHYLSKRARGPFIALNCGAVPGELVENELFGHEKGAFTGATTSSMGLIAEAQGGTLFLDEINSMPPKVQLTLLRFLEEREFRPVGSRKSRKADVRIIAASNSDLERAVEEGRFRRDLFYRLNVIPLALPPLRHRREDIPLLARHFLTKFAEKCNKRARRFTVEAVQKLLTHDWPGNVRELENSIERAVVLSGGINIQADEIPLSSQDEPAQKGFDSFNRMKERVVAEFERSYIRTVLVAHDNNISRAAAAAGKNRRAFWELMRKHHIEVDRNGEEIG